MENRKFQQRNRSYEKQSNGSYRTKKNKVTEIKSSLEWFDTKWR